MSSRIKNFAIRSGLLRWAARLRPSGVAILMYHSVMERPAAEAHTLGRIMHSSDVFRRQMEVLARDFNPVTLDDALEFVSGEKTLKGRPVVVTFDDGYSDNSEIAVPILNRVGVPATFYIAVESVDSHTLPWPSRLRHAMYTTRKIPGSHLMELRTRRLRLKNAIAHFCARVMSAANSPAQHKTITYAKSKLNWMHLSLRTKGTS